MITVREFMEVVDYRITEGGDYGWQCYGPNAYRLDSWNGDQNGHSVSVIFDTHTQVVYEVTAYDYRNERAYRLFNPEFKESFDQEALGRGASANEAWDDVNYVDLESDDDFIQKALAIVAGEDYDTRIEVPLDLPNDLLFELMKMAHDRDMTLNQLVEEIIKIEIQRLEVKGSPAMITGKKSKKKKK
jgi:hypothetical protein